MEEVWMYLLPVAGAAVAIAITFGWKWVKTYTAGTENTVDDSVVSFMESAGGPAVAKALKAVVESTDTPYDNQLVDAVLAELVTEESKKQPVE